RQHVDDDGARAERRPLCALTRHILYDARHHHLQTTTGAAGGDVNVHTCLLIPAGRDDLVTGQNLTTRQLLDFDDSIQYTACHIFKRSFNRCRRFTSVGLPVLITDLLDKNGFGGRAAAISRDNDVERTIDFRRDRSGSRHRAVAPFGADLASMIEIRRVTVSGRSSNRATCSTSLTLNA